MSTKACGSGKQQEPSSAATFTGIKGSQITKKRSIMKHCVTMDYASSAWWDTQRKDDWQAICQQHSLYSLYLLTFTAVFTISL